MADKLLYSVCESYDGSIGVHSYGGKTLDEETRYARSVNRRVFIVTSSWERAWSMCEEARWLKNREQQQKGA